MRLLHGRVFEDEAALGAAATQSAVACGKFVGKRAFQGAAAHHAAEARNNKAPAFAGASSGLV
jgi:hypothetical protein